MELEFDDEGGCADLSMGLNARTTLEVFRAEPRQVRVAINSRASHGEVSLGVGLDAEQTRRVGEFLLAQSTLLDEEERDDEEE